MVARWPLLEPVTKRPLRKSLTLSMMRALHAHLGIPASVLLRERNSPAVPDETVPWQRFPLKEMIARGWITGSIARDTPERLLTQFFAPIGSPAEIAAVFKKTESARTAHTIDKYALAAWSARIMIDRKSTRLNSSH